MRRVRRIAVVRGRILGRLLIGTGLGALASAPVAATPAFGQPVAARLGVGPSRDATSRYGAETPGAIGPGRSGLGRRASSPGDSAWWAPLASAVVPGAGQLRLGQGRFVTYLAVEAHALVGYAAGEAAVRRERGRYLSLARDIARAFVPGNEVRGDWAYYEAMARHIESGVFDRTPGTGLFTPESDTSTFNGSIWLRARQLSEWPNPDVEPPRSSPLYQNAVAYYVERAVRPEFRWTWRNAQLEWDAYRQSIRSKNEASRDARQYLALLALNHILSTVDAFVSVRLRGGLGATRGAYAVGAVLPVR